MTRSIAESEWKVFRELRGVALERFCDRTLDELGRLAADRSRPAHDRYLDAYRLIEERDRELSRAFDAPRRSQAMMQLALISSLGLLTPEELSRFFPATRESIDVTAAYLRAPRWRERR